MKTHGAIYSLCLAALTAMLAPQAFAYPLPVETGDRIEVNSGILNGQFSTNDWFGSTAGGSFTVSNLTNTTIADFLTFCLERDEYVDVPGGQYKVTLDDAAVNGGLGGQDPSFSNRDPLDTRTAYLYSTYINNPSALGIANEAQLSSAMQEVIWYLEDELLVADGGERISLDLLSDAAKALHALSDVANGGLYGVKVMNLSNSAPQFQSMLVASPIPEPSTLAVWGLLGVCGLMVARRRRK